MEYVDIENLSVRETFYITHLLPYYNVLKQGYSSLAYKHTEQTKQLLIELHKNKVHSDKTKALISKALLGDNNPFYNKSHSMDAKLRMIEANSAYPVYIYNSIKKLLVILPSVRTLAKLIHSNHSTIVSNIKNKTLFRGEWYFSNLPFSLTDTPLISNWPSKDYDNFILEMNNNYHIKKAIFLAKLPKINEEFCSNVNLKVSHTLKKN